MFTKFNQLITFLRQRRRRIRRNLEAARLRYARRHTHPQYERCMNCGTPLKGMYCHRCGQYALDIHQPLWKYIRQYFENMYQFDGKIWMTLRLMFTRPGFLTNEFNAGKINSYVHPFRLYMCMSVVFFAIFFMVAGDRTGMALTLTSTNEVPKPLLQKFRQGSLSPDTTVYALDAANIAEALRHKGVEDVDSMIRIATIGEDIPFRQVTLPHELLDSCFTRTSLSDWQQEDMMEQWKAYRMARWTLREDEAAESRRVLSLPIDTLTGRFLAPLYTCMRTTANEQLRRQATAGYVLGQLSKWTPFYLMFLLPVFALLLKAFERRKRMPYMHHFAHAVHINTVALLLFIPTSFLILEFLEPGEGENWHVFETLCYSLPPALLYLYLLISMRVVYRDGWGRTLVKSFLFSAVFTLIASGIAVWLAIRLTFAAIGKI